MSEPTPLLEAGEERSSSRQLVIASVACVLGGTALGAAYGFVTHTNLGTHTLWGGGVGVAASLGLIGFRAYRDTLQMRESANATNRTEDAWTAYAMGEVEKAEGLLKESLQRCCSKLGENNRTTLTVIHSLANLCRVRGLWKDAEALYRRALPIYLRLLGASPATAALYYDLALSLEGQRRLDEAIAAAQECVALRDKAPQLADSLALLGRLQFEHGQAEEARLSYAKAVELRAAQVKPSDPLLLTWLAAYARILFQLRRYQETEEYLTTLLEQFEHSEEPNYPAQVEALLDLGTLRLEQERYQESEALFVRGLKLLQHYVGPTDRLLQKILDGYRVLAERNAIRQVDGVVNLVTLFHGERERIRHVLDERPEWRNSRDATGWGPLQWAAFIGRDDVVRWLLTRGANAEFDAETCMGPLHVAAAWNRRDALMELLAAGASVNGRGAGGWTPLFWCAHAGRTKLAEMLLKKGADVDLRDDEGQTCLHVAAAQGSVSMVATLLGAGAKVNAKARSSGRSPLHVAALCGHLAVCECLIFNGAELKTTDAWNFTPVHLAEQRKHRLLVRAMRRHLSAGLGR